LEQIKQPLSKKVVEIIFGERKKPEIVYGETMNFFNVPDRSSPILSF